MKNTPRQNRLYLVSRIYELAAEFSYEDLQAIRGSFAINDDPNIIRAVDAILNLHGIVHDDFNVKERRKGEDSPPNVQRSVISTDNSISARYLEEIFDNREVFPRVQDISSIIPGGLEPSSKEGRSRYIKRVLRHISALEDFSKKELKNNLAKKLRAQPTNFISQWHKLIKDL